MHFAIGTTNSPKKSAVEHVLQTSPYTWATTCSFHRVASGVPDMPTTLREIRTWAKNRAIYTRREMPEADYFVGMEWWVYKDYEGETYWLLGVVYIENREGDWHFGYSCHLEVPEAVGDGLFDGRGRDLEEVIESLTGVWSVWDRQGSFHEWTDGMLTRRDQFIMATECALAPFFNHYYQL